MTALIAQTYTADSLWADLGGTYEQKSFDRKVQALTNPTGYAADRKTELDRIKAAAESAFTTSYRGFQDAGLSPDASKAAAYQSAQAEYQNQMRVFTLMFGQGTDAVYQTQAGYVRTGAVRNVMSAAPSRRAPAKRRRRKK
jgi:uncharacterized protein YdaL